MCHEVSSRILFLTKPFAAVRVPDSDRVNRLCGSKWPGLRSACGSGCRLHCGCLVVALRLHWVAVLFALVSHLLGVEVRLQ